MLAGRTSEVVVLVAGEMDTLDEIPLLPRGRIARACSDAAELGAIALPLCPMTWTRSSLYYTCVTLFVLHLCNSVSFTRFLRTLSAIASQYPGCQ